MKRIYCDLAPNFNTEKFQIGMAVHFVCYNRKGHIKTENIGYIHLINPLFIYIEDKEGLTIGEITAKDVYNGKSKIEILEDNKEGE